MLKLFKYLGACLMLLAAAMVAHAEEVETDTFTAKYNVDGFKLQGVAMYGENITIKLGHDEMGEIEIRVLTLSKKIDKARQERLLRMVRRSASEQFGLQFDEPFLTDQNYFMNGSDDSGKSVDVYVTFNKNGDKFSVVYASSDDSDNLFDLAPGYFNYHFTAKDPTLFTTFM